MTGPPADEGWHKLHPLTPVVRAGRVVAALVVLLLVSNPTGGDGNGGHDVWLTDVALIAVFVVLGVVHWLVTRWKLDGPTLRIETGLVRRDSRQLPVARIQAVDVFRPFLARLLGLAELRIRLAGSGSAGGRLAYLSEAEALDLRARLLAGHHGLDMATPEPVEQPVAVVPTGRLAASVLLSPGTVVTVLLALAVGLTGAVSRGVAVALGGTLLAYLLGSARVVWNRVSEQYGFTVGYAPDGIRVHRGLLGTVAETIPLRRVQAVRKMQPLLWRPFGWCRVEVEIAGGAAGAGQGARASTVTKALLPVGSEEAARLLVQRVVGRAEPPLSSPPSRARWKAPLSYHFLAAGADDALAMSVTGRVRAVTTWVPLHKVQSVRVVQGPLQRLLDLSSLHLDVAGRRVRAEFRDRDAHEVRRLLEDLAARTRTARHHDAAGPARAPAGPDVGSGPGPRWPDGGSASDGGALPPAGWYPDPAGGGRWQWWDGAAWTTHVAEAGPAPSGRAGPEAGPLGEEAP